MSDRMNTCVMHTESWLQRLRIVLLVSVALCCGACRSGGRIDYMPQCPPASSDAGVQQLVWMSGFMQSKPSA